MLSALSSLLGPWSLKSHFCSDASLRAGGDTDNSHWNLFCEKHCAVNFTVITSFNSPTTILKMKELRKVTYLAQGHTNYKWQSQDFHLHVARALDHSTVLSCMSLSSCIPLLTRRLVSRCLLLEPSIPYQLSSHLKVNTLAFRRQPSLGNSIILVLGKLLIHYFFSSNFFSFLGSVPWINSLYRVNH